MSRKREIKLADYFVVALKMLEFEENGERIWFSKLVKSFDKIQEISRETVAKSLNTLEDWLLIGSEYGETIPGHAGRLYYLTEEGEEKILEIKNSIAGRKIKIISEQ